MRNFSRSLSLAGLLTLLVFNPIAAQQPTQSERDAIRSACRSDFMAHCASVQPGGKEAFECLLQHDSQLSASCKSAVGAVARKSEPAAAEPPGTKPATAAGDEPKASPAQTPKASSAQPEEDQIKTVRQACTMDDFMAHCSWIQPSSAEVVLCLKANAATLSPSCRKAVTSLPGAAQPRSKQETGSKEQATAPPKQAEPAHATPPVPPQTGGLPKPAAAQKNAIRVACRSDFVSHCSGVQPGGAKALLCLQRNAERLSAPCKTALAAMTPGATAPPPAAPAASPAAAEVAPLGPMPPLRPRRAVAILRICGEDMRLLCGDMPAGGGRVISCLAENASRLSPVCYRALAAARGD